MTNYEKMLEEIRNLGMDYKWSKMFVKKLRDDETAFNVDDEKKKWALDRGFFPGRIELYGLNENNYQNYVPDFKYFMIHPMNNHFKFWVNDKLTLKYMLNSNGCQDSMPDYYLYIENDGSYTYLMNCPEDIEKDENFIWNLLRKKGILAMKPNSGTSGGLGFIKLELDSVGGGILENNRPVNMNRFNEIKNSMRNYIVTEYVKQHEDLAKIWPDSECTLRVIMCKNVKQNIFDGAAWSCVISYARFGTSVNGGASNLSSGGVGVGFDFETGKYNDFAIRYKKYCIDGIWKLKEHPDTKAVWSTLCLPNWSYVKSQIYKICNHLSSLDYLGFDIIITKNGMKLCEINTHPAMDYEQVMCGPALQKENICEFFDKKGLFKQDGKDFLNSYLRCQE